MGTDTSLACGVYVPRDPPTIVKWHKSEFPQNDTSTLISDNTDGYELRSQLATTPFPSGAFSGLFYDQYILVITTFTASDTGYYWCQIETNSTEDSLTLQPSQYGYRAPNPGQSDCTSGLQYFDLLDPAVCAVHIMPTPSFDPTISHTFTSRNSVLVSYPQTTGNTEFSSLHLGCHGLLSRESSKIPVAHIKFPPLNSSNSVSCSHTFTTVDIESMRVTSSTIFSTITPSASKCQVVTTLNPTSTVLPPSSDDYGLPTTVCIAVGAGGGAVVVITCIGVFLAMTICVASRSKPKREKESKTSHHTKGLWIHMFTLYYSF